MYLLINFSSNGNEILVWCLNRRACTGNSCRARAVQRLLCAL
jgi:hypothetical protein